MKRIIVLVVVVILMAVKSNAQIIDAPHALSISANGVVSGPISYSKGALLNSVGSIITEDQARNYFSEPQYNSYLKASKKQKIGVTLNNTGAIIAGIAIGYCAGSILGGGYFVEAAEVAVVGIGCSIPFFAAGIPLSLAGSKTLKNIVSDYNNAINGSPSIQPSVEVGFVGSGVGVALRF